MTKRKAKATTSVDLRLPTDLYNRLEELLANRRLSVTDAAALYLRSMVNTADKGRALSLSNEMPFGKFKGASVEHVIKVNPDYVQWLLTESKSFSLDPEALELLEDIVGSDAA